MGLFMTQHFSKDKWFFLQKLTQFQFLICLLSLPKVIYDL